MIMFMMYMYGKKFSKLHFLKLNNFSFSLLSFLFSPLLSSSLLSLSSSPLFSLLPFISPFPSLSLSLSLPSLLSSMYRVLNVLHHWVKDHYYDFEQDTSVLEQLKDFVGTVKAKNMQKWIASIHRALSKVCHMTCSHMMMMMMMIYILYLCLMC